MYQHIKKKQRVRYLYFRFLVFRAVFFFLSFLSFIGHIIELIFFRPFVFVYTAFFQRSKMIGHFTYFIIGVLCAVIGFIVFQTYTFVLSLPSPRQIGKVNYAVSSKIFDRNGILLYEMYHDQNRTPLKLDDLPKYIGWATVAIEDKDFYQHNGISLFGGIMRALKENLLNHSFQGGSTITQQLVKTALLTPQKTVKRKIKEIILALWTEHIFTKKKILEMYLNQVPYGGIAYGIEEASNVYFGKSAIQLTLGESAFLAGLPQAPSLYSPYNNPLRAKERRDEVLKKLYEEGYISEYEYIHTRATPLIVQLPKNPIKAPFFVFYIKSLLEDEYGIRQIEEGGLYVYTSLDMDIQNQAEHIVQEELKSVERFHVGNGAVLVTVPSTGEIVAMVGGRDYFASPSGAFNVTLASRQPGSMIKPIMYSLALSHGFTSATILDDSPISFPQVNGRYYSPMNYDNRFHGKIPLRLALANSYNVPAVKVLNNIGVSQFITHAQLMGITTWIHPERYGLALTLGGGEVKMIDIVTAFSAFANAGEKVELNPFLKIENYEGEKLYEKNKIKKDLVINPGIAFIISDILSDSFARRWAFGLRSALEVPGYKVAVKTGTTNEKRDNWTVGYTPDIMVATWVGNNDNSPMNQYVISGVTGAAPVWNKIMRYILDNGLDVRLSPTKNIHTFIQPDEVVQKKCYFGRVEFFLKGTEDGINCRLYTATPSPKPAH